MKIITLPQAFYPNQQADIYFLDYESRQHSINHKITFAYNAISFLLEGTKEIMFPTRQQVVTNQQILLIKSGNCLMTEKLSGNQCYRSVVLFFNDAAIHQCLSHLNHHLESHAPKESLPFQVIQKDEFIQNYLQSLTYANQYASMKKVKFEEIMLYLTEKLGRSLLDFFQTSPQEVNLMQVIEHNIMKNRSLEELAFLSNMSLSTFKRKFQQTYHTSPHKWMKERRLELAKNVLRTDAVRPSEVYMEYGFSSLSGFINDFKQKFGVTPKQFQLQDK